MKRNNFFPLLISTTALCWLVLSVSPVPAAFDVHDWQNPAGGAASDAGNWNPAAVPESNDDLQFNVNAVYEVIFDSQIPQVRSHSYRSGDITLRMISPHFNQPGQGGFVVGHLSGNHATVTLAEGLIQWSIPVTIGSFANSFGSLEVTSGNSVFEDQSFGTTVGGSGDGGLSVLNGGRYQCDNRLIAGLSVGSHGSILLSGRDGSQHSIIETLSPQDGEITIADLGAAEMLIGGDGQLTCAGSMFIGRQAGSVGYVEFASGGSDTFMHVLQDLNIGHNPGVAAAGNGTFVSFGGGAPSQVTIDGGVFVGDSDSGIGSLKLFDSNTTITVGGDFVCDPVNAELVFQAGTLLVHGEFVPPPGDFTLDGTEPTLVLKGGQAAFNANVFVGDVGEGTMILSDGATASLAPDGSRLQIGFDTTGDGSVVLRDAGTRLDLQLGSVRAQFGHGELSILDGAILNCTFADLGVNRNTFVGVVDGADSEWNISRALFLAGDIGRPGLSDAALDIINNARLTTGDPDQTSVIYSGGVLTIADGGEAEFAGTLRVQGDIAVHRGFLRAPDIDMISGSLRGSDTIVGNVAIQAAIVAPQSSSSSSGIMEVDGPVTFASQLGSLEIQIGGLEPGAQHDQLSVTDDVQLDGTLALQSLGEFEPQRNDEFVIVTGRNINGRFNDVEEDAVWSGLCYDVVYEPQQVKVAVIGPGNDSVIDSLSLERGVALGGGLEELKYLDNDYFQTRSGFGSTFIDLHSTLINIFVTAENPLDEFIDVFVEERIDKPSGISKLRLRDVNTGQFVQVAQFGLNLNDQRHDAQGIDAHRFMTPGGRIEIQIEHDVFVPFLAFTFQSFIDQIKVCTR